VGAVWVLVQTARRLGIDQALDTDSRPTGAVASRCAGAGAGSRLSAVRLAQVHAACDVLGIRRGFDENDLYANLSWLSEHQEALKSGCSPNARAAETGVVSLRRDQQLPGRRRQRLRRLRLPRDGKKGKKQIVIGLLCDEQGEPVSTEVFRGNTQDPKTFAAQVKKASERFGCAG